ncbi:MAG: Clp1/GlmU family protein [Euryarchaeota archaeon]|nr:Clp1/GlmU family protein [Euryarchaeota archaeon]
MLNGVRAIEEAMQDYLRHDQKPLTLFLLGGVDVGKTYTATALANRCYEHGLKVAVVDADVGQSDIGPPCCIGMGILERKIQMISEVPLHSLYFVGNTSPNGCMSECVDGAAAAVRKAKKFNADVVIVDSTGWIEGEDAKRFKLFEIKAIDPAFVIAIENEDELGHIIQHLNKEVITLRISSEARSRTREERRALREEAYNRYFRAAEDSVFEPSTLAWLPEEGTIVGLFDRICEGKGNGEGEDEDEEIQGLGILSKLDYESGKAVIFTSVDVENDTSIKRIKPGRVKLIKANGRFKEEAVKGKSEK